jgi:transporter family protein
MQNWLIYALGSAVFAALTAIFGKLGTTHINSNLATLIRTIVILAVCSLIVSLRHEWQKINFTDRGDIVYLIISGICTGLSWLCYYRALQLGQVSKVAPIDKLSVVFAIILGVLVLGEKLSPATVIGGGLIVAGSLVIAIFG